MFCNLTSDNLIKLYNAHVYIKHLESQRIDSGSPTMKYVKSAPNLIYLLTVKGISNKLNKKIPSECCCIFIK